MIIEITKLEKLPWEFEISIPPDKIGLDSGEAELSGNVVISGRVAKRDQIAEVSGTLSADAVLCCTRCLDPIAKKLEIEFSDSFGTSEMFGGSSDSEVDAADLGLSLFDGNEIDLGAVAREQILLNLPEQIFCREECRGLCPMCARNRNHENCECFRDETDPRWAALKSLK